jgi:hypothetical protein
VIDDGVEHQAEILPKRGHLVPGAERRVNGLVVHHREAIIGRSRVERQDVYAAHQSAQVLVAKVGQGTQRWLGWRAGSVQALDLVAIGNEQGVASSQRQLVCRRGRMQQAPVAVEQRRKVGVGAAGHRQAIEGSQLVK